MRPLLALAALLVAAVLGAVQLASTAAFGDLATHPSAAAALHDAAPGLLRPFIGGTYARAQAAVHQRDFATANALLAQLPSDARTLDLRGRIAEVQGDREAAIADYVGARDVVRAEALIDRVAHDDPARALAEQQRLVAGLGDDARATEVTGHAWWRLGELQAALGYRAPARRAQLWRAAAASYAHALAYKANDETYLLSAAYQDLANGDGASAQRRYARAADVDPKSADAHGGLALTAAARGDCATARAELARWTTSRFPTVDPRRDALNGAALRRCTQ